MRCGPLSPAPRGMFTKLSETASYLKDTEADREVYLIGTAHISAESAREVTEFIRQVRPDYVAVELCEQRYKKVKEMPEDAGKPHNFAESIQTVLAAVGKHGPLAGVFAALNEAMRNTGLVPGIDFYSAIKAAEEVGAKVSHLIAGGIELLTLMMHTDQAFAGPMCRCLVAGGAHRPRYRYHNALAP